MNRPRRIAKLFCRSGVGLIQGWQRPALSLRIERGRALMHLQCAALCRRVESRSWMSLTCGASTAIVPVGDAISRAFPAGQGVDL